MRRGRVLHRAAIEAERRWDAWRLARRAHRPPGHLRIEPYVGHGTAAEVVVRARILDGPEPPAAVEGEGLWAALRRTVAHFSTDELPGVAVRVTLGGTSVDTASDPEGYVTCRLRPTTLEPGAGWATATVELLPPYRGVWAPHRTPVPVRLSGAGAGVGVISDVDDTIVHTGAQRTVEMVRRTLTGSELTRVPFAGAPELYRALAAGDSRPVSYVSSSPWNLHAFLLAFLRRRAFPIGPLLLRDLLGDDPDRTHAGSKLAAIDELFELHPELSFVLIGDSGQHDPEVYAEVVRRHPGRVLAVYIREVRLDPGDGRVEAVLDRWEDRVPFVLAADSAMVADHARGLGLISAAEAATVVRAASP